MKGLISLAAAALLSVTLVGCSKKSPTPLAGPANVGVENSSESYPLSPTTISTTPGSANGAYQIGPLTTLDVGMGDDVAYRYPKRSSK